MQTTPILAVVHVPTSQMEEAADNAVDLTDSVDARLAQECGYSDDGGAYAPARTSVGMLDVVMRSVGIAQREILDIVTEGLVSIDALEEEGFGKLHEVCDANTLGGMCDEGFSASFVGTRDEAHDDGGEESQNMRWMEVCNLISDLIDAWLRTGGLRLLYGE